MAKRQFDPWFCAGCQKHHPISIWIEGGDGGAEKWCGPSIRRAIKSQANYLPKYHEEPGADAKPQLVIPGAERISTAQLLARKMTEPKRAKCDQREPGGLFSATVRDQLSLF